MNLYYLDMFLVVEADDLDEAMDLVEGVLMEPWVKDHEVQKVRTLPLIRSDEP